MESDYEIANDQPEENRGTHEGSFEGLEESYSFTSETDLSNDSSLIVREGKEEKVALKKSYSETVEIALLTLNFDKQRKNDSSFSEGLEGNFEDQLLKYNNNKLFIPGLSECFKDANTKFWKFLGEEVLLETSAQLNVLSNGDLLTAKIILTNYRLLLVPSDQSYLSTRNFRSDYFSIPLNMINHFYKGLEKKNQPPNSLYISTKSGSKFRLIFVSENMYDLLGIADILEKYIPFTHITNYFAFVFHAEYPHLEKDMKGWAIYDISKEFARQGLVLTSAFDTRETLSNVERYAFKKVKNLHPDGSGRICDTYPDEIIIPEMLSIEELIKCSKFRTKNRFPALAYCYRSPSLVGRVMTIWRSSQCKHGLGLYNHRSDEDEMYLRLIGNPSCKEIQKEGETSVHIYDARPYLNAVANKMNGKGYENITYYKNAEIFFLHIDNIHIVRDNYKKLIHFAAELDSEKWANSHDQNGWLYAIDLILVGAKTIIEKSLKKGINVLVHCSDGWDRTTQLISLVQLMLDPYFRTIEGFEVLIEKDWVSFGHMFRTRNGWKSNNPFEEDKRSPVFIQFLDCVHQLLNQFPYEFEFNLKFLTDLAYYSRTGLFGNFLCDCEAEMNQYNVKEKTTSIWSFINSNKNMYTQCLRKALGENIGIFKSQLTPSLGFANMRFWREFFFFHRVTSLEKPKFQNIEISHEKDLFEVALRYQIQMNEQLKYENAILTQRLNELTLNEEIENEGDINNSLELSSTQIQKRSKEETQFLVIPETDENERDFQSIE